MKIEDLPDEVVEAVRGAVPDNALGMLLAVVAQAIDAYLEATDQRRPCAFCGKPTQIVDNRRYHTSTVGHYWPCAGQTWKVAA